MIGQTHSLSTHRKYYVLQESNKKRKYEEGRDLQELYQTHLQNSSLPVTSLLQEGPVENSLQTFNTSIDPMKIIDINEVFEFGSARSDLQKKGSRFEWTNHEIDHLKNYILNIEPTLTENERKNKYSACLSYLKRADSSVQQDFHPHHCESSSRIKTGYDLAFKRIR